MIIKRALLINLLVRDTPLLISKHNVQKTSVSSGLPVLWPLIYLQARTGHLEHRRTFARACLHIRHKPLYYYPTPQTVNTTTEHCPGFLGARFWMLVSTVSLCLPPNAVIGTRDLRCQLFKQVADLFPRRLDVLEFQIHPTRIRGWCDYTSGQ